MQLMHDHTANLSTVCADPPWKFISQLQTQSPKRHQIHGPRDVTRKQKTSTINTYIKPESVVPRLLHNSDKDTLGQAVGPHRATDRTTNNGASTTEPFVSASNAIIHKPKTELPNNALQNHLRHKPCTNRQAYRDSESIVYVTYIICTKPNHTTKTDRQPTHLAALINAFSCC